MNLAEKFKLVQGIAPVTTNGIVTGDYISLKNAHRVTVIVSLDQATGHATTVSLMKAKTVAGGSAAAVTEVFPIWVNEDTGSSDTLVKETDDAASFAVDAIISDKMVVFEIDPAKLADTFDCIAVKTAASSQAGNHVSAVYIIHTRYPQATPPAAITD